MSLSKKLLVVAAVGCAVAGHCSVMYGMNALKHMNAPTQKDWVYYCREGNAEGINRCIKAGFDVNAPIPHYSHLNGYTPLMLAAESCNVPGVQALLENGAHVNGTDEYDLTALMMAAGSVAPEASHRMATVQLLLEKGANVNAADKAGSTALMKAIEINDMDIVQVFLEKGADIEAQHEPAPENADELTKMTNDGQTPFEGQTALMYAAQFGNPALVDTLIAKGAKLGATDRYGMTALMYAAKFPDSPDETKKCAIVKALLHAGADATAKNGSGETAADIAARWGHIKTSNVIRFYKRGHKKPAPTEDVGLGTSRVLS